jgi:scyllo-inositol 2-dehydrogenase (NADP+)
MPQTIRVGLIGYGFAGKTFHAPVITAVPHLELAAVVERRGARSKERYPWVTVVDDVRALYEDDTIDLVVVTTPSTNHAEFVRDALLAGKHVVVEKPFTATVAEADDLIALAQRQGKALSVFHNRRWDGDFLTVREILRQELLGQLVECEMRWDGFSPVLRAGNWREGEGQGAGVWYDLGVHFLDQALCLFGAPQTIAADIRMQRPGAVAHDYFDVTLGYAGQLTVRLRSSRFVRERSPRYALHGTRGSFVKYGTDPQEAALIAGQSPASTPGWGAEPRERWGVLNTSVGALHVEGAVETLPGAYQAYYQNIYDHLTGQVDLAVKPEQARMAIRLIELALQSQSEGRALSVTP